MSAFDDAMRWAARDNRRKDRERGRRGEGAQQQRQQRGGGAQRAIGTAINATTTTAGVAWVVAGTAIPLLPGGEQYSQASELGDWSETSLLAERARQSQDMDEATRDAGYRHGGWGQQ